MNIMVFFRNYFNWYFYSFLLLLVLLL